MLKRVQGNGHEPPLCPECGIEIVIPDGFRRVLHEEDCKFGQEREDRRTELRDRLARCDEAERSARFERKDRADQHMKSLKAPLGHREVAITTGAYNKKDPLDWCHKIHCQCGYEDIAWNYEDAAQARDDHWADIREEQGETAQEETPDPVPVPGSGTGETGTSSRTTQTKPRRLVY